MDGSLPVLALYFAAKGAAYCGWCGLGARLFRPAGTRVLGLALGLGVLRMVLGLLFGVAIFLGSALAVAGLTEGGSGMTLAMVLAYLGVYVPVRWIEWAIIEALLRRPARSFAGFLGGVDRTGRAWRLGGAAISCLADLPLILAAGGLPIGRFMC
jgi:hypothetical protein